jgi:hypothetical protein
MCGTDRLQIDSPKSDNHGRPQRVETTPSRVFKAAGRLRPFSHRGSAPVDDRYHRILIVPANSPNDSY